MRKPVPLGPYIYNLGTKNLSAGDFKVTISDATIASVTASFSIKK